MKTFFSQSWISKTLYRLRHWETWHWLVKYVPMIPFWIWHCIRARSLWFFTSANPTLTFGGYEGEPKTEMYSLLPTGCYPKTISITASSSEAHVKNLLRSSGLSFPVAAKPNVGRMGFMFRRINSLVELISYHEIMEADYLLQEFVHYPTEVSVFYYRYPSQQKGTITGFVRKEHLSVAGDGVSTLLTLILNYPRVQFRLQEMKVKHASNLDKVIPFGEHYVLCQALNLSRGGKLVSLEHEKDERLLEVIDNVSHTGGFYFGRYDIKCKSIEDLKRGENYQILEFNGSGAEPHHVYGNGNSFFEAIKILLQHWNILYQISLENHRNGIPYWSFMQGARHLLNARKHFKLLKTLEFRSSNARHPVAKATEEVKILQPLELRVKKSA